MRAFLLLALGACVSLPGDNDKAVDEPTNSLEVDVADPGVKVTVDGWAHAGNWGSTAPSCKLSISFVREEDDATAQTGVSGTVIATADEPGTCALTVFDPDEVIEAMEWDPPGYLDAGAEVYLEDEAGTIALQRVDQEDGTFAYTLQDCDVSTYPYGRVFDLDLPAGVATYEPLTLTDAVAVPPSFTLAQPTSDLIVDGGFAQYADEPLVLEWSLAGAPAIDLLGEPINVDVWLRNTDLINGNKTIEAVNCMPEEDTNRVEVGTDILAQLSPIDPQDPDRLALGGQIDLSVDARDLEAGWITTALLLTYAQMSGSIDLYAAE
jgi:hypothetical protein